MYDRRYARRQGANCAVFVALHQMRRDTGLFFHVSERGYDRVSTTVEIHIIDQVEKDSNMSSRVHARDCGISQTKVMHILHKN